MDAFVVAFRVPNLFRRVFGEGALAASMLPVFTAEHQRDPRAAWQLVSVLLALVAAGMTAIALLGEAVCGLLWWLTAPTGREAHILGLTATLLPYMVLICLAAQVSAVLQGLLRFRLPAVAPMLLNICWLAAAWFVAPQFAGEPVTQAYVIAAAIVFSGALQLAVQWPALRRAGFRFDFNWSAAAGGVRQIGRAKLPITLGLAVTQLNTLVDSFIAICLASPDGRQTIGWLGDAVRYPLETGAVAAIYYGERFYQLPVGVLGVAIATVIYPLLARHAARGDRQQIGADLSLGLRLVWFTALPAGVGILLVAKPVTQLLFVHGAFTADDARRAATMIACYATAAWAYCALPVLVRGFYALGDRATPTRAGVLAVGVNLAVTAALLWPLGERALALSTAAAASVQVVVLAAVFSRAGSPLDWPALRSTIVKGTAATAVMALVVMALAKLWSPGSTTVEQATQLAALVAAGGATYLAATWLLGMQELGILLPRSIWRTRHVTS